MINNDPTFTSQCLKCNKYGHKSNMCKIVTNNLKNGRNVRCYACGISGHFANQCRMRANQMNFRPMQGNVVCYFCNKSSHIAKHCKSRNMYKKGSEDKNK